MQQGAAAMEMEGGRTVVIVPEDHGDGDEDESSRRGQLDGDGLSHEGGMGRPGWVGGWPRRGEKTDDDDGKGEVEQTLEPLIPVPPSFALALCGPDSPRRTSTLDSQWSLVGGPLDTPQRPDHRPDHTTLPLSPTTRGTIFCDGNLCSVFRGRFQVDGTRAVSVFNLFLLVLHSISAGITSPPRETARVESSSPNPFPGFSEDPSSPMAWWTLDSGHSLSASLRWRFCNSSAQTAQRPWSLQKGPIDSHQYSSCVVLDSSEAHDEKPFGGFFGTECPTVQNSLSRLHLDMMMHHGA